jgi:hypothetical protein
MPHYPLLSFQLRQPERLSQPLNLLTRLNRFVRVIEERASRGATQVMKTKLNHLIEYEKLTL